ncbi:hypothetical protein Bca4012_010627 [Brassica carinata]
MSATKMFFISGFGYAGFSNLENFWDDLLFSRLNYNALDDLPLSRLDFSEVVWTSRKSSRLPGSFLTLSSFISSGVQACLCRGSDLEDFWDDLLFSRLNYNALDDLHVSRLDFLEDFLEVVWTSWKSSGSCLDFLRVF